MNRLIINSPAIFIILFLGSCNKPNAKLQTIENLKAAYKLEITKSAQYAACAHKTREEGMDRLSVLFSSVSKSKLICADYYKVALQQQGIATTSIKPEFEVKTTIENLRAAIDRETQDFTTLYPEFAETARDAKNERAEQLFHWSQNVEKRDIQYYTDAIKAIEQKMTNAFYTFYLICPQCGNIYYPHQVDDQCSVCSTKKEKFISEG